MIASVMFRVAEIEIGEPPKGSGPRHRPRQNATAATLEVAPETEVTVRHDPLSDVHVRNSPAARR